ncbi:MAG TPA: sigma-70 family RNA polymerase sigma factor [Candidatus Enterocloster excrementigallinarum]|uniref:Sigma-70 family RNA polymerase sigma factor n=1 Tax=Candidatus Enterocloster excrementigallinarum TaxID=2838558 RepID=A0A9D2TDH0_9FIRM|nr:sigma-70 family RNA polymerase sigma factor [Candidatus Enterocloster excrementigallinarum]
MEDLKHLVELSKKGDQQAIAQLYEQTSRRAYYLAKQLVKDEDQAQDIVQDAYVKVFTNLPLLEQVENFQGWLNTIVVNRSKDYLKKKKPMLFSQMVSEEDEGSELDFEDEGGYFSPDQKVDYAETKRLIQGMIDRLPQEQRMAIVLFYLEEMPVKQIARVMECSEGTVKSRLNYGRKAIKAQVLELEKKGTKLYCVPFIPFLYWLFRQQVLSTVVPGAVGKAAVAAGVAAAGKAGAASGGAAGAASRSAAAGAAVAGKTISAKAAAVIAAACIGAGGVGAGAGVYLHSRQAALETDADETAAEESENREEREEIEETSLAAQEDGPVQVEQNTQLIMGHLLSPLIYWNGQEPNFSVETADLSDSQRIELAYWNMNNNEDWELLDAGLQIFDTEGNSSDAAGIYSLSQVADRLADMYGGDISEEQLLSEAENGMLLKLTPEVEEGQITYEPMDGEGWTTVNFEEFTMNGGKLEADGTYTIDFNSGDRLEGKIEAVFIPNPDSFFGYTLESVTGAEREESQEVQASVASPRIYSTNELGSEYPETSAAETAPETSASAEASNYTMARCDICSDETMCRSVWVEAFGESLMICDSCMVELQWIGQQVQAEMNE